MLPNIGPLEVMVILVIALIVFGPKRLPELGRSLGKGIREFKGSISGEDDDDDASSRELEAGDSERVRKAGEREPVAHKRG